MPARLTPETHKSGWELPFKASRENEVELRPAQSLPRWAKDLRPNKYRANLSRLLLVTPILSSNAIDGSSFRQSQQWGGEEEMPFIKQVFPL